LSDGSFGIGGISGCGSGDDGGDDGADERCDTDGRTKIGAAAAAAGPLAVAASGLGLVTQGTGRFRCIAATLGGGGGGGGGKDAADKLRTDGEREAPWLNAWRASTIFKWSNRALAVACAVRATWRTVRLGKNAFASCSRMLYVSVFRHTLQPNQPSIPELR
jgi:hypothetical protein